MILEEMQMFDQEIAPARPVGQQSLHLLKSGQVDLPAFRRARRFTAAGTLAPALARTAGFRRIVHIHCVLPSLSF
jgi:hypothetical protein